MQEKMIKLLEELEIKDQRIAELEISEKRLQEELKRKDLRIAEVIISEKKLQKELKVYNDKEVNTFKATIGGNKSL